MCASLITQFMKEKTKRIYKGFGSTCVHSQVDLHKAVNTHTEAIYPTSTFAYDDANELMQIFKGEREGYIYGRWHNPTVEMAEKKIAALEAWNLKNEKGEQLELASKVFSSGMGAISALFLACLKPGDKVITQGTLYGGTNALLHQILEPINIVPVIIELKNLSLVEDCLKKDSSIKMIYIETPSNPTMDCYDIEALNSLAKKYQCICAVDNTFATPYLQQPFQYDVDFVLHSTTKYLNGHGTAIGGVLLGKDISFFNKRIIPVLKLIGANGNPFDAWTLIQGMKTLELRMERHCLNTMKVAEYLQGHSEIAHVNYCGFKSHPDFALIKKQMKNYTGMLSFELKGGLNAGIEMMNNISFCTLAVSLGTADTIIQHPASMSHLPVPKEERLKFGITDGLIRLSVGIENADDIIADLEQALAKN